MVGGRNEFMMYRTGQYSCIIQWSVLSVVESYLLLGEDYCDFLLE
jgi:hypothetical protein